MTKSYKAVLLEAFLELDGWHHAPELAVLASRSWQVLQRRRVLQSDLPESYQGTTGEPADWLAYWKKNPVAAWTRGKFFQEEQGLFIASVNITEAEAGEFSEMVQELVDYRFATYIARADVVPVPVTQITAGANKVELPYFPSLKIACGHFRTADAGDPE